MNPEIAAELREAIKGELGSLCERFGAHAATLHLYDAVQDRLAFPIGFGLREKERFEWLPSERGPAATIFQQGSPVFAEDARHHPQFRGPFTFDEGVRSGAAFPLALEGEKLGIVFLNYREERRFSADEKDSIREAIVQVATKVQNWLDDDIWADIRSQEGLRREHEALLSVVEGICDLLGDTESIIWLFDRDEGLVANAHWGLGGMSSSIVGAEIEDSGHSVLSRVFRTRSVDSASVDEEMWPQDRVHEEGRKKRRWQSVWAFPLDGYGVLAIYTVGYAGLTSREQDTGRVFAEQARATIAAHDRIRVLETLSNVGNRLNLAFVRPTDLLETIVEAAAHVMDADWITLHQYDPEQQRFLDAEYSVTYPLERREGLKTARKEGGASALVRDEGQIVISDISKYDPEVVDTLHVRKLDVQAYIGVRLEANDQVLGVLFFNYRQPRKFSRDDHTVVNLFADYSASAIRNARLLDGVREREKDLAVLGEVGRVLTSSLPRKRAEIVEVIHQQASRLMDMSNSYIALYDETSQTIRFVLVYEGGDRIPDENLQMGSESKWAPRPFGSGRTEAIIESRESILHRTKSEAENWYAQPEHEEYIGQISASWVGAPLVVGGEVLGVIAAHDPVSEYVFDTYDREVMESIASYAAIALDNARLYYDVVQKLQDSLQKLERKSDDLLILNRMAQVLTSGITLKRSEILELIHEQADKLMDTRNMYIALYEPETNLVSFGLAFENGERVEVGVGPWAPRPVGAGATEFIIRNAQPLLFRTAEEARKWYAQPGREEYTGSIPKRYGYLGVPMMYRDRVLGVIALRHLKEDNVYDETDLVTLSTIGSQAAIALYNAELYSERVEELEGLYNLVTAVAREGDWRELLKIAAAKTKEIIRADTVTVCPYDAESGEFDLPAAVVDDQPQPRPTKDGTAARIIASGDLIWADDAQAHELWRESDFVQERGVKSCAAVPLVAEGEKVGVLFVNFFKQHRFEETEIRLLQAIGKQIALAIARAGLRAKNLERANIQLETVLGVVQERGVYKNPVDYVKSILEQTMKRIKYISGSTYQSYDASEDTLTLLVSIPQSTRRTYDSISIEEGVSGEAIRKGDLVSYADVSSTPSYLPLFGDTRSEVAVPVEHDGRPFGVLNFESTYRDAFSAFDIELLGLVGAVSAPAIYDKFKTYERHQEEKKREREIERARVARAAVHAVGNNASKIEIYADDLLRSLDVSGRERERLERIREHAGATNDLISRLVGEIADSRAELIDVRSTIVDAVNLAEVEEGIRLVSNAREEVEEEIKLINNARERLPLILIENGQLCATILELITNAQKALEESRKGEKWIRIETDVVQEGRYLDILVSNNGPPIPREHWEIIFHGNYRPAGAQQERPGARKGLFLARDFVQRYQGSIQVVRSDSQVTEFRLRFPVATQASGNR